MKATRSNVLFMCLAALGIPALFCAIYYWGYRVGLFPSEAGDLLALGVSVVLGMLIVYALPFEGRFVRTAAVIAYAVAMSGILFVVGLGVACANGNCL